MSGREYEIQQRERGINERKVTIKEKHDSLYV